MALTRITKGVIKPNENYDTHNINSTGIVTATGANITGNLTVGGVLTYEDVTSIDSVGIITAQKDIHVGAGVSAVGVGTFGSLDISGDVDVDGHTNLDNVSIAGITTVALNQELVFGSNADSQLTGRIKQLSGSSPSMQITSRYPRINALDFRIHNISNNQHYAYFWSTEVALFHQGNKKFSTTGGGIDVTGNTVADGLVIDGNSDLNGDLDVDGHTNLDNVSIAGVTTFSDHVSIGADSKQLRFGAGNDLTLEHNGSDSYITSGTGNFVIQHSNNSGDFEIKANDFYVKSYANENYIRAQADGAVELYHNNQKKLETKGYGIDITGGFITTGGSIVNDGGNIKFGTGSDLQIFHDNSNNINVIQCHNGRTLHIDKDNGAENMAKFIPDGAVELYHDDTLKLSTTSNGINVSGSVSILDSSRYYFGSSNDAYLYHDGSNTHFVNGTGHLLFRQAANSDVVIQSNATDRFRIYNDGVVAIGQSSKSSTVGAGNLDIQGNATSCIIEMGNPFPTYSGGIVPEFRITATNSSHTVDFESVWGGDNLLHKHLAFSGGSTIFYKGTTSDEVARFNQDKFGVGTNNPGQLIHTHSGSSSGGLAIQSNGSTNYIAAVQSANNFITGSTAGGLAIRSGNGIEFSGNDGSSVQMRLESDGDVTVNTGTLYIPQWISHVGDTDSKFGFLQPDIIEFQVAGTQRLKIMNTGQIRIDQATSANNGIRMRPSGWNYDFRMGAVSSSGGSIWLGQNYEPTGGTRDSSSYGTNYLRFTTQGEIHFGTGATDTNPSVRLQIHSGGDISIPTVGAKIYTNNSGGNLTIQGGATYPGSAIKFNGGANGGTGVMHFYAGNATSLSERMTLTAAGRLGLGYTSPAAKFHFRDTGNGNSNGFLYETGSGGTGARFVFKTCDNSDESKYIQHSGYWTEIGCHQNEGVRFRDAVNNVIRFSMSGSSGNYNFTGSNTSDRNLKENIETITTSSIDLIKQVIPRTFKWKHDSNNTPHGGFIAQEMQPLFPKLVNGTEYDESRTDYSGSKTGTTGGCNPTGMGFDYNGYSAYLTKAMQELIAKVESLEAEVASLKGS